MKLENLMILFLIIIFILATLSALFFGINYSTIEKVDTIEVQCVDGNLNEIEGNLHCYKDVMCSKYFKFFNEEECKNYEGYN